MKSDTADTILELLLYGSYSLIYLALLLGILRLIFGKDPSDD